VSFNGVIYVRGVNDVGLWALFDLIVAIERMSPRIIIKAMILIIQASQTRGMRRFTIMGKITPPTDEPEIAMP
jgi:hypothetical protein